MKFRPTTRAARAARAETRRAAKAGAPEPPAAAPPDGDAAASSPPPPAPDAPRALGYDRLSIAMDPATGAIMWDAMRPATQEKLKTGLADPESVKRLGMSPASAAPPPSAAPSADDLALCGMLYDAIGSIAFSLARAAGYSADQATVMKFTEQEKAGLLPPTAKVFNKYARGFKYTDEVMLSIAVVSIVSGKVQELKAQQPGGGTVLSIARPPIVPESQPS